MNDPFFSFLNSQSTHPSKNSPADGKFSKDEVASGMGIKRSALNALAPLFLFRLLNYTHSNGSHSEYQSGKSECDSPNCTWYIFNNRLDCRNGKASDRN